MVAIGCVAPAGLPWPARLALAAPDQASGATVVRSATDALALAGTRARVASGKAFFGQAQYTGSPSCKGCRAEQYRRWAESWHAKMDRWPN